MLTIIWDVDDVLNDFMRDWFEQEWLSRHPDARVAYADLRANPPHRTLGITEAAYQESIDDFRTKRMAELKPLPEAEDWFRRHGTRYRHAALTAVPLACAAASASWVVRHFGQWIRSFHFVPSRRSTAPAAFDETKSDFLRRWQGDTVVVDDRPENLAAAQQLSIQAVLMPRPWNESRNTIAGTFEELSRL